MKIPSQVLRDRIIVEEFEAAGALGPLFRVPKTIRAFVQPDNTLGFDSYGRSVNITAKGAIRPESGPLALESKVTMKSTGKVFRVIACAAMPDAVRPTHWEITLGNWDAKGAVGSGGGS